MQKDLYQIVTDKIVADLEQGELTWIKPWNSSHLDGRVIRPLRYNGQPYSGINVLMLWAAAVEAGFASPHWMTFRQAQEIGGHVRKGERGSLVVYANTITRTEHGEDGQDEERSIPFMKGYTVLNVEQIEGLPEQYRSISEPVIDPVQWIGHAEAFFAASGADIRHGGNRAYYSGGSDHVQMPSFPMFHSPDAYYATLAHELTHWTKHQKRLDRDFGRKAWGDAGYAREELVAELGAAFLCADLGLRAEPSADHAAYIQSWLKVLRDDRRAIFTAAAHAQRAADYLHGFQTGQTQKTEVAA